MSVVAVPRSWLGLLRDCRAFLLDFLLPKRCIGCGEAKTFWCVNCQQQITFDAGFRCPSCLRPSAAGLPCLACGSSRSPLSRLLVACDYRQPALRTALHQLKYHAIVELAEPLSRLLCRYLTHLRHAGSLTSGYDLVLPVPLHPRRELYRGFNQAQLLAAPVAAAFGWPWAPDVLRRTRYRRAQVGQGLRQRQRNVRGAFSVVHAGAVAGKSVLLVDDVVTSGSTMASCAAALRAAGASSVTGLALAHG